jgi:mono/diheme cytochrome c family protein
MRKLLTLLSILLVVALTACFTSRGDTFRNNNSQLGMGPGSGMMDRHHVQVPREYSELRNPISANDESLERGRNIYTEYCATCHGDYGNGDGPGGVSLDPVPAAIAHTSQMMSDAYLFWRITEGGTSFETGMIPYRDILSENERWDVINYVRALGNGQIQPDNFIGGERFDGTFELRNRAEMLSQAVGEGLITRVEADIFDLVHAEIDRYTQEESLSGLSSIHGRADGLPEILDCLVTSGEISREAMVTFLEIHGILIDAGVME